MGNLARWYGLSGSCRLFCDWLSTKLLFPHARLVRRPFYIRGKRWIRIGSDFTTGPGVRLDAISLGAGSEPVLIIGCDVQFNDYVHIAAISSVTIGDRVLIASKVFITDHNHGVYRGPVAQSNPLVPPAQRGLTAAPVNVKDDVWIGEFVAVLPGVTIGEGSIIGTMSVVTHDVPPYSIAIGNPARVVKRFNFATSEWEPV
jgi:lipopolysaccharide O-acetyltransferase